MAELKSMQDQSKADKDKSGVEYEKRINPDGSYVEFTTDHQNKRGEPMISPKIAPYILYLQRSSVIRKV